MKIIAGLGNPGDRYANTRHNVGFQVLDALASHWGLVWKTQKFKALLTEKDIGGEKVLLVKPQTFMNESGQSVGPALSFYKLELSDLLVVYDDLALPLGTLKFARAGSSGGHNGIKSILAHGGGDNFNRLRIGIGHPGIKEAVVGYVLSAFAKEESELHEKVVEQAYQAVICYAEKSLQDAMNEYSGKVV